MGLIPAILLAAAVQIDFRPTVGEEYTYAVESGSWFKFKTGTYLRYQSSQAVSIKVVSRTDGLTTLLRHNQAEHAAIVAFPIEERPPNMVEDTKFIHQETFAVNRFGDSLDARPSHLKDTWAFGLNLAIEWNVGCKATFIYPSYQVRPGDSWTRRYPYIGGPHLDALTTFTYLGPEAEGGTPCFKVAFSVQTANQPKPDVVGTYWIEAATGMVERIEAGSRDAFFKARDYPSAVEHRTFIRVHRTRK